LQRLGQHAHRLGCRQTLLATGRRFTFGQQQLRLLVRFGGQHHLGVQLALVQILAHRL
jgi:hypothetical protein